MREFSYEQLLASECKGEVESGKVREILSTIPDGIENFNRTIIETISKIEEDKTTNVMRTDALIDESLKHEMRSSAKKVDTDNLSLEIKKNLRSFYSLKYCPSYLYHKKILGTEDYEYLLEVYSDYYSSNKEEIKESAKTLQDIMNEYIDKILSDCKSGATPEELKEMLGYL